MAVQVNCTRFCHICYLICTIIYFNINIGNNNKIIYTMKHTNYIKLFLIATALFVSQSVWAQWSGN